MHRINDIVSAWSPRERVLAGSALLAMIVLISVMVLHKPSDVAPETGANDVAAATATQVESSASAAASAKLPNPSSSAPSYASVPAAPGSEGSGSGGSAAMADIKAATSAENELNNGVNPQIYSDKPTTSRAVAATGALLEKTAAEYTKCIKGAKDWRGCIRVVPQGVVVEQFLDNGGGLNAYAMSADGHRVGIAVDSGNYCRSLDSGENCTAWTVL